MEGDKLFKFTEVDRCACCGCVRELYILAETQEEANIIRVRGGGLCGYCMCENIMDTHGYTTTKVENEHRG